MQRRRNSHEPFLPCSWDDVPLILELKEAAQMLRYTPEHLVKLAQLDDPNERFPAGRIGTHWRVEKQSFIDYLVRHKIITQKEARQ